MKLLDSLSIATKRVISSYENLFVLIALVVGLGLILITPPLWGLDEISHFSRVYQISQGNIFPDKGDVDTYGGPIPVNLDNLKEHVVSDFQDNVGGSLLERGDLTGSEVYESLTSKEFNDHDTVIFTWTASYSPFAYLGHVIGAIISNILNLNIGQTIALTRLSGLIFYISLVYVAIRIHRNNIKLQPLLFVVALIPTSIYQASVVTVDSTSIAFSLLFVSLLFYVLLNRDKVSSSILKYVAVLSLIAGMLALTKVNYLLLGFLVLFIPNKYYKNNRYALLGRSIGLVCTILPAVLWAMVNQGVGAAPVSQRPDGLEVSSSGQLMYVLDSPIEFILVFVKSLIHYGDAYVVSVFNVMGNTFSSFIWVTILFIIMLFLAAFYAKSIFQKYSNIIHAGFLISILCIGSIFLALYLVFNPVGNHIIDGVQGRYFIPIIVPTVAFIATMIPIKIQIKSENLKYGLSANILTLLIVCLISYWMSIY